MAIAKPLIIIDGCNALNLMKSFAGETGKSFQANCSKLISLIQNFSYQSSRRFIIVFDGFSAAGRNQNFGENVSVIYSGKKIADLVIEKMTLERNAKLIEVVTSDNEVAAVCRNHGAKVMKVPDFERQIEFYGGQLDRHMVTQKGGKAAAPANPLSDNLDGDSAKKLADLSVELQKREMEARTAKEAETRKTKELKEKASKDSAAKKAQPAGGSKTVISDADADLFTEMFAGAKRVVSKKYADDGSQQVKSGKTSKKIAGKDAPKDEKQSRDAGDEFDWTKHIDDSFKGGKTKR